ncbi:MAG: tetratricopeptide repeat protein [Proteobacteria bacterium]|nr:tetratricopeptide repeat protein [Pseudomonadota bacterium]
MTNTAATLTQAIGAHQNGRLQEAMRLYQQVLHAEPRNVDALRLMGLALSSIGRQAEAIACYDRALAIQPSLAIAHRGRGMALMQLGKAQEALASFNTAVRLAPNDEVSLNSMGVILLSLGQAAMALASFDRALALQPNDPTASHNRGLALMSLARYDEARQSFERTLQLAPGSVPTLMWRGKCYLEMGRPAEALASLQQACTLAPGDFAANFQLGITLARLNRKDEAVAAFSAAIAGNARSAEAFNNRGAVLVRQFRPADAIADFRRAIELNPGYADAYVNYGNTLKGLGQYSAALQQLDHALTLKPGDLTARWSKALIQLSRGNFAEGWPLYESRLELEPARQLQRNYNRPRWTGAEPLNGRSLLVHAEQGLGDTLQFARYIRPLEDLGARVVFEVQPVLMQLLRSLPTQATLIARGDPVPDTDFHTPLLSLPLALQTRLDTIPGGAPYLSVDTQAEQTWRERLTALPGRKIGILWHGNPEAEQISALQARSYPLAAAAPLAQLSGVTLVSLQKGPGAEQRRQVDFADRVVQLTDPQHMGAAELATETAPLLKCLDLVITADTALAHLAGALGVRVWLVLQSVPDWRWLVDRSDSPWYPSMRLFRQRTAGNWVEVFEDIAGVIATTRDF